MNERCERFRELMADSLSSELAAPDRAELEGHLERCGACREYLTSLRDDDRLLQGYVAHMRRPISEMTAVTLASLGTAGEPATEETVPFWRGIMRLRYAALLLIIAAAGWAVGRLSGAFQGSAPAMARVLEEMGKARNVSYRMSYRVEGIEPFESKVAVNSLGTMRSELPQLGTVTIHEWISGKQFQVNNRSKKVTLTHRFGRPPGERMSDYVDWIRTLHGRPAEFAGTETVDGRKMRLFVNDEDLYRVMRIWVDPDTNLPVKVQFVNIPNPNNDIISPRIVLRKFDFGGSPEESYGISYTASGGITPSSTLTMHEIVWNADLEDSLFSLGVPEGYALEVDSLDVSDEGEGDLIEALALWARMSGGAFPDDINDLGTSDRAVPLLIAAFDGDGDPEREFDEAVEAANALCKGCLVAQEMKAEGEWRYVGKGVRIGDPGAPVCWWRERDQDRFRVLYGDCRVEKVREEKLPAH